MYANHYNCDCLECMKANTYESYFDRLSYMMPDNVEGQPSEFLDGTLVALKPMIIYSRPDGNNIRSVKANQTVGKIYSYVVKDGVVWWQLYDNQGFVKHGSGLFDAQMLQSSIAAVKSASDAKVKAAADKRINANREKLISDLTPDFLGDLKWYLIGIVVIVVLIMIYKITK